MISFENKDFCNKIFNYFGIKFEKNFKIEIFKNKKTRHCEALKLINEKNEVIFMVDFSLKDKSILFGEMPLLIKNEEFFTYLDVNQNIKDYLIIQSKLLKSFNILNKKADIINQYLEFSIDIDDNINFYNKIIELSISFKGGKDISPNVNFRNVVLEKYIMNKFKEYDIHVDLSTESDFKDTLNLLEIIDY